MRDERYGGCFKLIALHVSMLHLKLCHNQWGSKVVYSRMVYNYNWKHCDNAFPVT